MRNDKVNNLNNSIMMKKAVFCLLVALMLVPVMSMAQKQAKAGVMITKDTVVCDSCYWAVNGMTYKSSDIIMYRLNADTTFVLNLTVAKSTSEDVALTVPCQYQFMREVLTRDTNIVDTLTSRFGCDSVVNISLSVTHKVFDTLAVTTCHPYTFGGEEYSVSGHYNDTVVDANLGCDSIHVLNLTMMDVMNRSIDVSKCGQYRWALKDSTYKASTTDFFQFVAPAGSAECDSLITLNLTITHLDDTVRASACEEYKISGRNKTYTVSGTYYDTTIASGCPTHRVYILNIAAMRVTDTTYDTAACVGLNLLFSTSNRETMKYEDLATGRTTSFDGVLQGINFSSSAYATIHYKSTRSNLCFDSTIHVNVTIHKTGRFVEEVAACNKYEWNYVVDRFDTTFSDEERTIVNKIDTIHDTLRHRVFSATRNDSVKVGSSINRCDSFYVVSVKINPNPVISSINGKFKVLGNESTKLYAECDQENVTYTWSYGNQNKTVDTLVVLGSSLNGNTDVTVRATNNETGCYGENWITILYGVGINDVEQVRMDLYPNPTAQMLNINCEKPLKRVVVYNSVGIEVFRQVVNASSTTLNLSALAKGAYAVRCELEDGSTVVRRVVKNK